jgi:tetratricopeptide (TPR) repeat protein
LAAVIFDNILKINVAEDYEKIEIQSSLIEKIAVAKILYNTFSKYPFDKYKYFNKKGFEPIYNTNYKHFSEFTLKEDIDKNTYQILDQYFNVYSKIDEIHMKYGVYLYKNKNYIGAYNEFLLAFRQNPLNISALNNMAIIRFSSGDEADALNMQQGVFGLAPSYGIGAMNLWYMYKMKDELEKAKECESQLKKLRIEKNNINSLIFDTF